MQRTEVAIRAVLEADDYTLGDLADLKVGQVLKLQATPRSRVKVESSEQPLFWAYLGQNEGFHTLCIDEAIDPEREFINDVLLADVALWVRCWRPAAWSQPCTPAEALDRDLADYRRRSPTSMPRSPPPTAPSAAGGEGGTSRRRSPTASQAKRCSPATGNRAATA